MKILWLAKGKQLQDAEVTQKLSCCCCSFAAACVACHMPHALCCTAAGRELQESSWQMSTQTKADGGQDADGDVVRARLHLNLGAAGVSLCWVCVYLLCVCVPAVCACVLC